MTSNVRALSLPVLAGSALIIVLIKSQSQQTAKDNKTLYTNTTLVPVTNKYFRNVPICTFYSTSLPRKNFLLQTSSTNNSLINKKRTNLYVQHHQQQTSLLTILYRHRQSSKLHLPTKSPLKSQELILQKPPTIMKIIGFLAFLAAPSVATITSSATATMPIEQPVSILIQ